ncbi:glycosyltransferase family 2 protein [Mesonia ostreae]|uniref:Glycosyltransferase family 2 protein n=1 Tax=Mesonia ostreae TaxID=861110 RepID=A0ABU2KIW6_9FLAO|nr:glycosyltransferase family 2 protein [Mesonia ostreae]MDT0294660.1 glycosyltransferase family 2 protein [Mesonia ostreae]
MDLKTPQLAIILPCYNEETILDYSKSHLLKKLTYLMDEKKISADSKLCFVDDGSKDDTWKILDSYKEKSIIAIKLANNFGHQFALLAGLDTLKNNFDIYITIDVDLQDDIDCIDKMIDAYDNGDDIVYGVRNDRQNDTYFKRKTATLFYDLMLRMGVKSIKHHADFRLISNKVLLEFLKFKESHLFLRGIFPEIGFKQGVVYYKRKERSLGESKYPLKKMLAFAWDGITSFSNKPLKIVLYIGVFSIILSFFLTLYALIQLLIGNVVSGWTSILIAVVFFGGIQTLAIGVIGEYIGKIYYQVKGRPRYIIEKLKNA